MPPLVIAHRGASGHAWENSPTAFRLAHELGADGVELDVHATRDGGLIVHHDAAIPGLGPISELTSATIATARLPNGEPIPTLVQALDLLRGLDVWVEVKALPPAADAALFAALEAGPTPDRYAVHSFDHRIIARLGRARPTLRFGALEASYQFDPAQVLRETGAETLWQEQHLVDADLVRVVARAGGQVIAWTANEPADIARLVRAGVHGICGNYPERIRALVAQGPGSD
ncbi:MAG: glycerophosphodiester phosphodiesterase [Gemmatimonadota bacterium]